MDLDQAAEPLSIAASTTAEAAYASRTGRTAARRHLAAWVGGGLTA